MDVVRRTGGGVMGGMVGDARKRQAEVVSEQVLAATPAPDAASLDAARAQYRGQVREAYDEVDRLRVRIRQLQVDLERESARSGSLVAEARRQASRADALQVQRDDVQANRDELARKVAAQRSALAASEQLDQNPDKQGAPGVGVGEIGCVALGITPREGDGEMVGSEDGEGERLVHRLHVCGTPSSAPHATDRATLAEVLTERGLENGLRPTPTEGADAVLASDWLAQRDRRVRAEVLREAADYLPGEDRLPDEPTARIAVKRWLRERANQLDPTPSEGATP